MYLEFGSIDWDSLRVTLLSEQDIVLAHYTLALLRAWRAMVIEVGLQVLIVLAGIKALIGLALIFGDEPARIDWGAVLGDFELIVILAVVYVLEPFRRIRT